MRRFVSVWLPALAIERMRRAMPSAVPADEDAAPPFALVAPDARGPVLTALNGTAHRAGLRPGMTLADARAILPALLTRAAEPARDRRALLRLARWADRYGPARNVDGDGFWIDVTGVAHLFSPCADADAHAGHTDAAHSTGEPPAASSTERGTERGTERAAERAAEKALLGDLARRLARSGLTARLALADTRDGAHALARFGRTGPTGCLIAAPGATARALANLPVEALRLEPDAAVLLRRLGLKRIGQLYDLPRAALARRFREAPGTRRGTDGSTGKASRATSAREALAGAVLARLDAALGRDPTPAAALTAPADFTARNILAEPLITSAGIEAAVADLIATLAGTLAAAGCGARRVSVLLTRTDGTHATFAAGLSVASRDGAHLAALLLPRLAAFDAGFGVDGVVVAADGVERFDARQHGLASDLACDLVSGPATQDAMSVLVDRLVNRLGADAVLRLQPRASHIPERAQRRMPALPAITLPSPKLAAAPRTRPPLLLATPEPIVVLAGIPEGPPARFTWRRLTCRIVKAEGPERIAPEWWRLTPSPGAASSRPRDYYSVEDAHGARYWLYRDGLYGAPDTETGGTDMGKTGTGETGMGSVDTPPTWYMHGLGA